MDNVYIKGTGSYAPENVVKNDYFDAIGSSDEWIYSKLGIKERRISTGEVTSDLAYKAGLKAIENANLKYPILILSNDNGTIKYIVDGHHRIQKASKYKIPTVSAKLIKFSELPKKFREVLGGDKEEESEGVGAYAAPAFEMMPDHEHFKHLYEEDNDKKNTWKEVNGKLIKK